MATPATGRQSRQVNALLISGFLTVTLSSAASESALRLRCDDHIFINLLMGDAVQRIREMRRNVEIIGGSISYGAQRKPRSNEVTPLSLGVNKCVTSPHHTVIARQR